MVQHFHLGIHRGPVIGALLIVNMLMATRISLSRSIHPLLKRTPHSLLSPKHFHKSHPCPLWSPSFSFCLQTFHKSTSPPLSLSYHSCSSLSASLMEDSISIESNPLLQDFDFPPFDAVEPKHVRPGIRALLKSLVCYLFPQIVLRFEFCVVSFTRFC